MFFAPSGTLHFQLTWHCVRHACMASALCLPLDLWLLRGLPLAALHFICAPGAHRSSPKSHMTRSKSL